MCIICIMYVYVCAFVFVYVCVCVGICICMIMYVLACVICNYLTHGRFSAGPSGREACHVLRIKMATRCQSMCPRSFGLGSGWLRIP